MEGSLLYVSRRLATPADIRDIVETSRVRNARIQVTGALVASRGRFAQILEGPRAALDALMDSIRRDRRHTEVEVVMHTDIERRRFPEWTLAYSGTSVFVNGLIEALAKQADTRGHAGDVQRLVQAIEGLSRARP